MNIRERLSPNQSATRKFPVVGEREPSPFTTDSWRLTVDGLVAQPLTWSLAQFMQLPPVDTVWDTTFGTPIMTSFSAENTGDFALTMLNPILSGPAASQFSILSTFPVLIGAGDPPASIVLRCTPIGPVAGTRTATFSFNTDDPKHLTVSFDLTCNGTALPVAGFGSLPADPGPLVFATTHVGSNSTASISVIETGNATLNVTGAALGGANSGDFIVVTAVPFSIADGGAAKLLTVQCQPLDVGLRTATLTLTTNDPRPQPIVFNLSCPAVVPPTPYLAAGTSIGNSPPHGLSGAYGIAASADGKNVYASGYYSGSVTTFSRNTTTGALAYVAQDVVMVLGINVGRGMRLLAASPDGKNVYAAASLDDRLVTFKRDPNSGDLTTFHGNSDFGLGGAYGVTLSPDGRFVYATGTSDHAVVVYSRSNSDGLLTYVQTFQSLADVGGAHGLTVSPDGASLYVTGYRSTISGTLAVFSRNALNGQISLVERHENFDGICFLPPCTDGLNGAFQVLVSPDGANVYTVGTYDGALSAFRRNQANGKLTYLGVYRDGVNGVDGLNGVSGITISPDGLQVVTTGYNDKAVSVFDRDPLTGLLSFSQVIKRNPFSGAGGNPPLDGARDVRFSADGRNVYAAAFVDDSGVVLNVANPAPQINTLNPASTVAGSGAFVLSVTGVDFVPSSVVRWNGSNRTTTFVNSFELKANLQAADVASAGIGVVTVRNPTPGGGTSNSVNFTVSAPGQNPVPSIDYLSPQGKAAGSGAFTIQIVGSNFLAGSQVKWNGQNRTTHFANSTSLSADIIAVDIAQPGQSALTVFNPGPGGGTSNVAAFDAAAPGSNPLPSISELGPAWAFSHGAASKSITLVVTGTNFLNTTTAQWNGSDRQTFYISPTILHVTLTPGDLSVLGFAGITVQNPVPGGGLSNAAAFEVKKLYTLVLPLLRK